MANHSTRSVSDAVGQRLSEQNRVTPSPPRGQPHVAGRRAWLTSTGVLTLAVVLSAGWTPWIQAIGGAFRPPDFAADVAAARVVADHGNPYSSDFAALHARVLGVPENRGYPYLPHPPFAIVVALPFARLPFAAASLIWYVVSLALLFLLAVVLTTVVVTSTPRRYARLPQVLTTFGILLLWPPVLYNLEKGQFSILLAVLVGISWLRLERRDCVGGGLCIGLAAALKIFPALLGGFLIFDRRRAATSSVVSGCVLTGIALLFLGLRTVPEFIRQSVANVDYWETWPAVNYSLHALIARTVKGGQWAHPLVHLPTVGAFLSAATTLALVTVMLALTRRSIAKTQALIFAMWSILLLLTNPLAMGHNGVLLALPIGLIGKALGTTRRNAPRAMWSLGVALASLPRQTIFRMIDAASVTPLQSIGIVAAPMWGTLLLFAAAASVLFEEGRLDKRQDESNVRVSTVREATAFQFLGALR